MGGQGTPLGIFQREAIGWAGLEDDGRDGLHHPILRPKAAEPVRLHGRLLPISLQFSCKMNLNLPKIQFLMLWGKGSFLLRGLAHATLSLKLPPPSPQRLALSTVVSQPKVT